FLDGGRWYLVMDFIDGQTLEEYLNGGNFRTYKRRLPIDEVLDIGIQLSAILDYLHNCQPPIIFRDLKPANIMLTPERYLYLFDFGIARHFKAGQTRDTATFGSVGYAAPEQYGRAQTTPRSDIYSLGVTLHQLLSGRDPALMPFRFVPLHLPNQAPLAELERMIMRMVDIDEHKRPASMAIVKQELQRFVVERTTGKGYGDQTAAGGTSLQTTSSAAIALPLQGTTHCVYHGHSHRVLGVAWSPVSGHLASGSGDGTVQVWNAISGEEVLIYRGHAEWVKVVAWSPDGVRIASAGADGTVQVWDALTGRNALVYRGHTNIVSALAWSPDGTRIASGGYDKVIHIWDVSDRERLFSYDDHDGIVNTVAWSPDGMRVASASDDHTVHIWPVSATQARGGSTRTLVFVYSGHKDKVSAVAWSPSGKRLCSGSWDNTIQVWDANTGSYVFTHSGHTSWINAVAWSPNGTHIASASNDKMVQVWEVGDPREYFTKRFFFTYDGHTEWVRDVAWSPDGQYIVSGGHDETVRVWQAR
ncbi:MAG TPA: serine/threonine-protein kinase, partial [Ktedonobacteraceae bacterium]